MKKFAFDVYVNNVPYTVSMDMEADDHWDAQEQIYETICNEFARDKDDKKFLFKQAAQQFYKEFVEALNNGAIDDVREV